MPESISQNYRIARDHPCFAGHFPGNPIVPGVIILDYTQRLLNYWKPGYLINTIPQAKFHQSLQPDQNFKIRLVEKTTATINFECFANDIKLASGILTIKPEV